MAPAETTAKPEQPEPPKVNDKIKTAQNPSTDPASADCQQSIDPDMEKSLGECSSSWDDLPEKLFEPTPFQEQK